MKITEEMLENSDLNEEEKDFIRLNSGREVTPEFKTKAMKLSYFLRKELALKAWAKFWKINSC